MRRRRFLAGAALLAIPRLAAAQNTVTCVAVDGHTTVTGGSLSPLGWGLWLAIAVLIGRLWRVPATRRARARTAAA